MKKVCLIQCLVIALVSVFLFSEVRAMGLGAYYTFGSGSGEWTVNTEDEDDVDIDTDDSGTGFGIVFDTALAKDTLFNYRLGLGLESKEYEFEDGPKLEMDNFVFDNDFGFGVFRTPMVRIWLGPELKISYGTGDVEDLDYSVISMGVGGVLGLNFNIGERITLGVKSGYLLEYTAGYGEDDNGDSVDHTGQDDFFYVNFAIMYRFNDTF